MNKLNELKPGQSARIEQVGGEGPSASIFWIWASSRVQKSP